MSSRAEQARNEVKRLRTRGIPTRIIAPAQSQCASNPDHCNGASWKSGPFKGRVKVALQNRA